MEYLLNFYGYFPKKLYIDGYIIEKLYRNNFIDLLYFLREAENNFPIQPKLSILKIDYKTGEI